MTIEKKPKFTYALINILRRIKNDKISAARKFEKTLNKKIKNLVNFPYQCRASHYFEEKAYRDMVHQGYTIIYKVEKERIIILEIFKWQER